MPTRPRRRVHRPEKKVSFFGRLAGLLGFGATFADEKGKLVKLAYRLGLDVTGIASARNTSLVYKAFRDAFYAIYPSGTAEHSYIEPPTGVSEPQTPADLQTYINHITETEGIGSAHIREFYKLQAAVGLQKLRVHKDDITNMIRGNDISQVFGEGDISTYTQIPKPDKETWSSYVDWIYDAVAAARQRAKAQFRRKFGDGKLFVSRLPSLEGTAGAAAASAELYANAARNKKTNDQPFDDDKRKVLQAFKLVRAALAEALLGRLKLGNTHPKIAEVNASVEKLKGHMKRAAEAKANVDLLSSPSAVPETPEHVVEDVEQEAEAVAKEAPEPTGVEGGAPPAPPAPTVTNVDLSAQQNAVNVAAPGAAPTLDQAEPNYNQEHYAFAQKQTVYAKAVEKLAEAYNQAIQDGKNPTGVTLAPVPSDTDAKLEVERKKAIEAVWAKLVEDKGDGTGTIHIKVEAIKAAKTQIDTDVPTIDGINTNVNNAVTNGGYDAGEVKQSDANAAAVAVTNAMTEAGSAESNALGQYSMHFTATNIYDRFKNATTSANIEREKNELNTTLLKVITDEYAKITALANTVAAAKTKAEEAKKALDVAVAAFMTGTDPKSHAGRMKAAREKIDTPVTGAEAKAKEVTRLKGEVANDVAAIRAAVKAIQDLGTPADPTAAATVKAELAKAEAALVAVTTTMNAVLSAANYETAASQALADAEAAVGKMGGAAVTPKSLSDLEVDLDTKIQEIVAALGDATKDMGTAGFEKQTKEGKKIATDAAAAAAAAAGLPPPPAPMAAKEAKDTLDAVIARHPSMQMFTDDAVGRAVAQRLMTPSGRASVHAELARFIEDLDTGIAAWLGKHKTALRFIGAPPTDLSGPNAIVAYNVIDQMRKDAKYKPVQFGKKKAARPTGFAFAETDPATKAYCNMIRVRTLALVGITCVPFTWLFSPDRAQPHLLAFINACIENGHAVAHEIELSGSKVPAVTFMTPDSAEEFMRMSSGSLVKHWVHAVAEATGGLLQSGFNAFRIVSFTTPTILAKYMEHYSSILGTYAP